MTNISGGYRSNTEKEKCIFSVSWGLVEPCYTSAFGLGAIKSGVSQSLELVVIAMDYVFHTQGWPLRLLSVDSKSGREIPTAT